MTLRDALAEWNRNPPNFPEVIEAFEVIEAAARRVAEAPEVWWCEVHDSSADDPPSDFPHFCLAEQVNGHDADEDEPYCRMVRKLLVDPPEEDRE